MNQEKKPFPPVLIIHLIGFLFLTGALSINPLKVAGSFFSDEAVYYTMTYSIAFDRDMEFQRKDLLRVHEEFDGGPLGIILKLNERDRNLVFGKGYLYAVLAAPFVRLFATNGFLIFHSILLWLNLLCGYKIASSVMSQKMAMLFSAFYFLANASLVYLFWMMPEYLNMSLICYAVFFFVSAERSQSRILLFKSPYNYLISAFCFALATYSKPTNILLILPLGIWLFLRKKILTALLALSLFILTTVGLFGLNMYFTGQWNYQAGKRSLFYSQYPYERPGVYDMAPFEKKQPIDAMVKPPFYWNAFFSNWSYFFIGRYSGLAIYFFPMLFILFYFLFSKKDGLSIAVYSAGWIGILTYMLGLPWNYFGGSGTLGNRYLLNAFPVLLFAINSEPENKTLAAGTCFSVLFCAVFLFTPSFSSFRNAYHQENSILFRALPVEKTLIGDVPITAANRARRITFDDPASFFVYFLDDQTYYKEFHKEQAGFWVKGEKTTEIILRSFQQVSTLRLRLTSLAAQNKVVLDCGAGAESFSFPSGGTQDHDVRLGTPFLYDRDNTGATFLYRIKIRSTSGKIYESNGNERYLGVFVRPELPEAQTTRKIEPDRDLEP